ncbi:MAG: hypothetical protein R3C99_09285 [Pirellulaceae bacterium]
MTDRHWFVCATRDRLGRFASDAEKAGFRGDLRRDILVLYNPLCRKHFAFQYGGERQATVDGLKSIGSTLEAAAWWIREPQGGASLSEVPFSEWEGVLMFLLFLVCARFLRANGIGYFGADCPRTKMRPARR